MAEIRAPLLALFLVGCGGVAGEELFAPTPFTPPGLCPTSNGDCDEQPAPIQVVEVPWTIAAVSKPAGPLDAAEPRASALPDAGGGCGTGGSGLGFEGGAQ